jgi:hypothetical protein
MGKIDWRHLTEYRAVRSALVVLGFILIGLAPLLGPLPGPGGIFVFARGAFAGAEVQRLGEAPVREVEAAPPQEGEWADWGLRRASAKRRQALLKAQQEAEAGAGELTSGGDLPNGSGNEGRPRGGGPFNSSIQGSSDEAHLPAEQSRAQAQARLPGRTATVGGRKILAARRARGRKNLSA